ncbi:hypothetical protein Mapa_016381 [Marchantia paleacea]|nr:hypothetical protein Mapa_016381 [Marchantia paleacea]
MLVDHFSLTYFECRWMFKDRRSEKYMLGLDKKGFELAIQDIVEARVPAICKSNLKRGMWKSCGSIKPH